MPIEEDVESCGSRATNSSSPHATSRHHRQKLEVYTEVLRRIQESNFHEANLPGFDDELWLHFNRLPARYLPCPSPSFWVLWEFLVGHWSMIFYVTLNLERSVQIMLCPGWEMC